MAIITINKTDAATTVDGFGLGGQDVSALASNIHAIQFDSSANTGHIEYNDDTANETITSLTSDMQSLVTINTNAKTTADAEDTALKNSYQYKRQAEYPFIGDQLDALYHAGTFDATMTAKIKAVKDKYPK
jgi:hypothetical protein